MPRNYPPEPGYEQRRFAAERRVWEALQDLSDDSVVFAQYRMVTREDRRREADFVVLVPGVGIAVIEVKGGWVSSRRRQWFSRDVEGREHPIKDPMAQADAAGFGLRDFVQSLGVPWPGHTPVVVLPDTALPDDFSPSDSRRDQWIDGLDRLCLRVLEAMRSPVVSARQVDAIAAALEQRLPGPRQWERAKQVARNADEVTAQRSVILRSLRSNNRLLVTGGPGSGKTWLAFQHARDEARRGARVALLCYNRGLGQWLARRAGELPPDERPAYCGTLHQFVLDVTGTPVPEGAGQVFWDDLPALLRDAVFPRFDVVVVDEGQDFSPAWWDAVQTLLDDPDDGPLVVFGDRDQQVYAGRVLGAQPTEVELQENLRNTAEVAAVLEALTGTEQTTRDVHGPVPFLLATAGVIDHATDVVRELIGTGAYRAGDIALLTTHRRHPEQVRRLEQFGPVDFAGTMLDDHSVAVSTVKGFKGLERPVVVLAVNGFHPEDDPLRIMTVGVSRAMYHLVIVADPQELVARFGDDLVQKCG